MRFVRARAAVDAFIDLSRAFYAIAFGDQGV
jgi:hypothetical protein